LDAELRTLDDEEKAFFRRGTKISDNEELKKRIIAVQTEAYPVSSIFARSVHFEYCKVNLGRLPAYDDLLKLGRERKGAIFTDLGCCFGKNVRKAVQGGYLQRNAWRRIFVP
ncbi:hypothetical protein BDZ97DRAFT_1668650, partial [Flammula alnicola]